MRRLAALFGAALALAAPALSEAAERRLVLVTLDGMHWREVFNGADAARVADKAFVHETDDVRMRFVAPQDRARALMPFLHDVVARQGVLLGDRDHGSCAAVSNDMWFSYPGYNEILTGKPDPKIKSNEFGPNPNVTFLEWLNRKPAYRGKVQVTASWNAYEDIVNAKRSGVAVSDGWDDLPAATPEQAKIAAFARWSPRLWSTVRNDALTHAYAMETLKREKPRVLYVAYGETDDFAHEGRYDLTLDAAHRADGYIRELWEAVQADPAYRGNTTLIVTTDHGRGEGAADAWKHHGKPLHKGSDAIWIAAIGPDVAVGAKPKDCVSQSQIAATALAVLGEDWKAYDASAGAPLPILKGR